MIEIGTGGLPHDIGVHWIAATPDTGRECGFRP